MDIELRIVTATGEIRRVSTLDEADQLAVADRYALADECALLDPVSLFTASFVQVLTLHIRQGLRSPRKYLILTPLTERMHIYCQEHGNMWDSIPYIVDKNGRADVDILKTHITMEEL